MTTYRVGEAGATVFNEAGDAIATLRPGAVVVEGRLTDSGSLADQHQEQVKRRKGYADKSRRAERDYEDKSS